MQPFLNMQFVEFDREHRERGVSSADPDGFFPEQHGVRPDPIGRVLNRYFDAVENIVQFFRERRSQVRDEAIVPPGPVIVERNIEDEREKAA